MKTIVDRIAELAKFGIDEKGRGYRVAYSKAYRRRAWFMDLMKRQGLTLILIPQETSKTKRQKS
jgi:N-carbamoyl-L-amino-acid hydrolase